MKNLLVRGSFVVLAVIVIVVGVWSDAGARPSPQDPDDIKCPWPACTLTCDPTFQFGYCTEGRNGKVVAAPNYNCCCCSEDAKNRYFHGG